MVGPFMLGALAVQGWWPRWLSLSKYSDISHLAEFGVVFLLFMIGLELSFERLSRMISDMLFLAKSDNQLIVPHPEDVDLVDEVKGVFEFYEALAEEKSITLRCTGAGVVSGDRLMLRRAISNVISNALRYTSEGMSIAVVVEEDSAAVSLTVANPGKPIPAEHLPRLFDRFYRVDGSRQRFSDGVGLGLAITRSIMRAHGGDADVRSDAAGTVFTLTFPRRLAESETAAHKN